MIKVEPEDHEKQFKAQESKKRRLVDYFVLSVWSLASFLGHLPFKWDKETKTCSFKWVSPETIFSFVRLVLFNFPSIVLPSVFYFLYYNDEWIDEPMDPFQGEKTYNANGTNSNSSSSAQLSSSDLVQTLDYFTNYSLLILSELQKHTALSNLFSIILQKRGCVCSQIWLQLSHKINTSEEMYLIYVCFCNFLSHSYHLKLWYSQ